MLKKTKRLSIVISIISIVEVVLILIGFLLYENNVLSIKEFFSTANMFYFLLGMTIFNSLLLLISILALSHYRKQNDIYSKNIFDMNVSGSFEFAKLGIAVVDDAKTILWVNEFMNQLNIDLLDHNILDVFPKLRDINTYAEKQENVLVTSNAKTFEVSFLPKAGVYFFKDNSDFENLLKYSNEQQMVIGIVTMDNLSQFSENQEEESGDLIAKVRTKILDYFKYYGVLLKRYKNDSYFTVCNYNSLVQLESDDFGILDTVRSMTNDEDVSVTLSIGFAHDYPGPYKLNEKANSALEMAISRGGDQVVVDKNGCDLKFFGGKTEAVLKQNKIKARMVAGSFINIIKSSSNVIIMGHAVSDMDSVGSSLGVKAICNSLGIKASVVYDFKSIEKKAKLAISSIFSKEEFDGIFVTAKEALNLINNRTLLVCVDFSKPSLALSKDLLDACSKIAIIDHHRRSEEFIDSPVFTHIVSSASSASELVTELISYSPSNPPITIMDDYATVMLAGIFVDTNFYRSTSTGARTFEASMILRRFGADNIAADNLLKDEYEERALIAKILTTIKTPYNGIVYCTAPEDMVIDPVVLSKVANECISMKAVNASFVLGKSSPTDIKISARSDGTVNVQLLCEKLGQGGGHFSIAAASMKEYSMKQVEELLLSTLKNNLDEARLDNEHSDQGGIRK